jgi:CRISPR-associated exonuclease Cas4
MQKTRFKNSTGNIIRSTLNLIPVNWLHTHGYCEYLLFLEKAVGLETPPSDEMVAGAKHHARLDKEHAKQAEVSLTLPQAAMKAKEESILLVSRDIPVKGKNLFGRIDEVVFEPNSVIIIDDKPGVRPYHSNKIQVWGYCQAFSQSYVPTVPVFGALREETDGKIVWLEQFTSARDRMVTDAVERIKSVLNGRQNPEPIGNIRKCRSCRMTASCPAATRK